MDLENLATKQPDDDNDEDEVILKPKKPKRVCSEKQLDALKLNRAKAAALRTEEADTKKLKKAIDLVETADRLNQSRRDLESKKIVETKEDIKKPHKPSGQVLVVPTPLERPILKETPKQVEKPNCDSESEEEEVVVVKKKKKVEIVEKPKKKKKVITIEISDSESDEEEEPEVIQKPLPSSRKMVSLQNKKSLIKVHKPEQQFNYFCD
jgi:hypothetical protein